MNQGEWKPPDYRRGTERVGTVIVAAAGVLMAAGAIFVALLFFLVFLNNGY
ncbi:hypothetical protein [Streptomyces sp. NRRL F-2580]|uniref:hypothetical protein n=1 Tax=Streptomyces sp. NRRL F-2580 TaxID=1463841 RepID=UPI000AB5B5A0|nr:hypothetical protein [Streptomyces sp. NRRL F-2580]